MKKSYDRSAPAGGSLIRLSSKFRLRPEHVAAAMVIIGVAGLAVMVLWTR